MILIGGGGHSLVVAGLAKLCGFNLSGVLDVSSKCKAVLIGGLPYLGASISNLNNISDYVFACSIGSQTVTENRQKLFLEAKNLGAQFPPLIHPTAFVANTAKVQEGAQIMAGVIIQEFAQVAENVIVNTSASLDHECSTGPHAHIAPGVTVSGCVKIGARCHIGTGAKIIQNIFIGDDVLVAAGALVVRDIKSNTMVKGIPAKTFNSTQSY